MKGTLRRLRYAIIAHEAALTVQTYDSTAIEWAATQSSLGKALYALDAREPNLGLLYDAIAAHTAALTVLTYGADPMQWATSQGFLGNALRSGRI